MADWKALFTYALERHGVLHVSQAPLFGLSSQGLWSHARRHGWRVPGRGVVILPGSPETIQQHAMVGITAMGLHRVLVSRRAAAFVHGGIRAEPASIELVLPYGRPRTSLDGLELPVPVTTWRSRTLLTSDAALVDGVAVTTMARTIVDLAGSVRLDDLRSLVIDARQRRLVTLDAIRAVHERITRYPGRAQVARVLADLDEEDCDSRLEWDFRKDARRRGFRPYHQPFPFTCLDGVTIEIDVAFPEAWVACECDGLSSRADRSQLTKHHKRQNRAVEAGWRPFLVDWTRLKQEPDTLFAELAALLASAPDRPPAPMADPAAVHPQFRAHRRR